MKKRKSNNRKKEEWFAFTSERSMLRLIRGQGILSWFDVMKPPKAFYEAAELDILGFVNRECRALRKSLTKKS